MGLDMFLLKDHTESEFGIEICYFRKANAIHNWFVQNVQNGIDDCGFYKVTKEQLKVLLGLCNEVLSKSKLVPGHVITCYAYKNQQLVPEYKDDYVVEDSTVASNLLPTIEGFFFGSTDYDSYYIEDLRFLKEKLEEIIGTYDFNKYSLVYHSSW